MKARIDAETKRTREAQQQLDEIMQQLREMEQREARMQEIRDELGYNSEAPRFTPDLVAAARKDLGYVQGKTNIVFVGNVNVGKSSLVNALCGITNKHPTAARVGGSQVTLTTACYETRHHSDIMLFDTPGAGTMDVPAFRFYYEQKLYAFDAVVLVHDTTLTTANIRLLQMCSLAHQPCVAVRTRADSHIENYAKDFECKLEEAREMYLAEARQDIAECQAKITQKWPEHGIQIRDHIVSATGVRNILEGAASSDDPAVAYIDEWDLVCALSLRPAAPGIANAPYE
ncbi:hypothetical protein M440DRAFT_1403927 [Trichoderma longibrachiatum ATCC 18648]|uniref:IRG-type G domain-containing protein n=1 Tax=Trichoderma longibrachiatum ATCC 18648 TaxID=983965 RepID=A0A2T4BWV1_TRILO|nr:hypothetical protein M440DRAFT_1403927 [Trichoderma longibrachiatum ATCC 18648]